MTAFAGVGPLARLALRRSRIMIAAWVYALAALVYASVVSTAKLYPSAASRAAFAAGAGRNPVTVALYGPAADLPTLGGLAMWKMTALGAVLVAVMSISLVIRHTRADEDAGRLELAGAGAVGRSAALTSALAVAVAVNLMLALAVAAAALIAGLAWMPSLAFALGLASAGCLFAAFAGAAAQVASGARAAIGLSAAALGAVYLLRAVGDAAGPGSWAAGLSWASPIGWTEQLRPFGPLRWPVLAIPVLAAVGVAGVGFALARRRDLGTGMLPARPGRAAAGRSLSGPFGLACRLQRATFLTWAAGFAVYGAILGAIANGVASLAGNGPAVREMFAKLGGPGGLTQAFLAAVLGFMGVIAAVYSVQAVLRLRAEENGQLAEAVLAGGVGRVRWALGHLAFAMLGPVALLALAGAAAGLAHGARTGGIGTAAPQLLGAALSQAPATWVLAGLALALFGLAPRLAQGAWALLVGFLFLGEFGSLLGLSQWLMDLSPFTHLPKLPGGAVTAAPYLWLTLAAAALAAAGLAALRRRDMA